MMMAQINPSLLAQMPQAGTSGWILAASKFTYYNAAITKGSDLSTANITIATATAQCGANAKCKGFTYRCKQQQCAAPPGIVTVLFKGDANLISNSAWAAYVKYVPPPPTPAPAPTNFSIAKSYGSHMVLQRAPQRATIWGFTNSTDPISVQLAADGGSSTVATVSAKLLPGSRWVAVLPATKAALSANGGGAQKHTVTVLQGAMSIALTDVLFGEVWACSGQSNMAFILENSFGGADLVQQANDYPELRLFTTAKKTATVPMLELLGVEQPWSVANNVSVSDDGKARVGVGSGDDNWLYMSAVCYLYGLGVHKALGVPVGLMNTNWGGTAIQDWMGADALAACVHEEVDPVQQQQQQQQQGRGRLALSAPVSAPRVPTHLFNAMVSPLLNHTIAGVVWWQGESNGGAPVPYGCQMAALVADWRAKWHAGSNGNTAAAFPFGLVQLAGCPDDSDSIAGVAIRMFQTGGSANSTPSGHLPNALMPNTFMAVAYDLGDETSPFGAVHIRYKTDVADRLVAGGLKQAYGFADSYTGPVFAGAKKFSSTAGSNSANTVTLSFTNTGAKGLALSAMNVSTVHPQTNWSGATPFEVCVGNTSTCALMSRFDGWSAPATTAIGADGSSVVLGLDASSGTVAAVRFAWRGYPCQHKQCGLYSKAEHLPPPPFWVELK